MWQLKASPSILILSGLKSISREFLKMGEGEDFLSCCLSKSLCGFQGLGEDYAILNLSFGAINCVKVQVASF